MYANQATGEGQTARAAQHQSPPRADDYFINIASQDDVLSTPGVSPKHEEMYAATGTAAPTSSHHSSSSDETKPVPGLSVGHGLAEKYRTLRINLDAACREYKPSDDLRMTKATEQTIRAGNLSDSTKQTANIVNLLQTSATELKNFVKRVFRDSYQSDYSSESVAEALNTITHHLTKAQEVKAKMVSGEIHHFHYIDKFIKETNELTDRLIYKCLEKMHYTLNKAEGVKSFLVQPDYFYDDLRNDLLTAMEWSIRVFDLLNQNEFFNTKIIEREDFTPNEELAETISITELLDSARQNLAQALEIANATKPPATRL